MSWFLYEKCKKKMRGAISVPLLPKALEFAKVIIGYLVDILLPRSPEITAYGGLGL